MYLKSEGNSNKEKMTDFRVSVDETKKTKTMAFPTYTGYPY